MHRIFEKAPMPSTMEEKVEYLMDRAAILDVFSRFFLAVDDKDWSVASECLTDPFSMLVGNNRWNDPTLDGEPVARAQWIEALATRNTGWFQTLHMHPNELVVIRGDEAHLASYQLVPHSVGLQDGETYTSWGFYDVDLLRCENEWRLNRIKIGARLVNNVNIAEINKRVQQRASEMRASPGND